MSKSEKQWSVVSGQWSVRPTRLGLYCLLLTAYCLLFSGCRQDMQDQPRYEPYEASTSFKDGLSSRPPVEGTVPRGYLRADKQLYTGQNNRAPGAANNQNQGGAGAANANAQAGGANTQ